MVRRRVIISGISSFFGVLVASGILFWRMAAPEPPAIRLESIERVRAADPGIRDEYDLLLSGLPGLARADVWAARLYVGFHLESGSYLSDRGISYEILDERGTVLRKDLWKSPSIPMLTVRVVHTRPKLIVPFEARSIRLQLEFRPPTPSDRSAILLRRSGLSKRCPRLSSWISKSLPNHERWVEHRETIQLEALPTANSPHLE